MATSTVEDYLKSILLAEQGRDSARVPTGRVAQALAVTPGTATAMVQTLAESGLVDYEAYGGVRLTPAGRQLALHVLRRHRLVPRRRSGDPSGNIRRDTKTLFSAELDHQPFKVATLRAAAWGAGLLAGVGGLGAALDVALGRPAADVAVAALGLAALAVGLARLAHRVRQPTAPAGRP